MSHGEVSLTHLCRLYQPILIHCTSPFPILGLLRDIFHFYSNSKRAFCKQTVANLIRRCVLRRVIWFCTVCRRPTKRTQGLYGLKHTDLVFFGERLLLLKLANGSYLIFLDGFLVKRVLERAVPLRSWF